jgi:hypothetical protein
MVVESTPFGEGADKDLMGRIREGMTVLDATGNEVGTVKYVQMADPNAATVEPSEQDTVFEGRTLFSPGDDDKVTDRMMHTGYFKVDTKGLFSSDKYITPEMVESVMEDNIRLKYDKDDIPEPA